MCGIVGAVSGKNITSIVTHCLKKLEYRGYDSAGIAVINAQNNLKCIKIAGKIDLLMDELKNSPLKGNTGIAHTRWATHGIPNKNNAHPQTSHNTVAVVHNGIIENHEQLRNYLIQKGIKFNSDTDTEVIAHLVYYYLNGKRDLLQAVHRATEDLVGTYSLAIISSKEPDKMIAVKYGSPAVIGVGDDANFVASDAVALLPVTNRFVYLENGDLAVVERNDFKIYNSKLKKVKRKIKPSKMSVENVGLDGYDHFMLKEIFEQPRILADTMEDQLLPDGVSPSIFGNNSEEAFGKTKKILIVACGSSYHAALVGKYWFEKHTGISCQVEVASEFCYRKVVVDPGTLFVTISQSGETADTLAALNKAKKLSFINYLTICNSPESSLVRGSSLVFLTKAGIEIGVATTKAFTSQLTALLMLTISLGKYQKLTSKQAIFLIKQLKKLPKLVNNVLQLDKKIAKLALLLQHSSSAFYLGRGISYPIAMEGALKIKEISYVHAEGYPAGELKHGALALVDEKSVAVAILPNDVVHKKMLSNLHEVNLRGGTLIVFADKSLKCKSHGSWHICQMPRIPQDISAIVYTIPLQLLSYHVALLRKTDIDQPRNLAKSVTVE